jgi:hypothetical protein
MGTPAMILSRIFHEGRRFPVAQFGAIMPEAQALGKPQRLGDKT